MSSLARALKVFVTWSEGVTWAAKRLAWGELASEQQGGWSFASLISTRQFDEQMFRYQKWRRGGGQ